MPEVRSDIFGAAEPRADVSSVFAEARADAYTPAGSGAPVHVAGQVVAYFQDNTDADGLFTVSLPAPVTPGNAVLVAVGLAAQTASAVVSDIANGTYTTDATNARVLDPAMTNAVALQLFWIDGAAAGTQAFSVQTTAFGRAWIIAAEFSGVGAFNRHANPAPALDQLTSGDLDGLTTANELIVGVIGTRASTGTEIDFNAGAGFTKLGEAQRPATRQCMAMQYRVVASATQAGSTFVPTETPGMHCANLCATFVGA